MRWGIGIGVFVAVVALGSMIAAQEAKPGGPLGAILSTLGIIEAHTSAIQRQVTDQATGLPAVQATLADLGSTVGALDSRIGKLQTGVEGLAGRIEILPPAIERLERLQSPVSRAWIAPYWADGETGGGGGTAHLIFFSQIKVLNPGNGTAHSGCTFFNSDGTLAFDRGMSLTIGIGAVGSCDSRWVDTGTVGSGWVLVSGDRPVLPYGWLRHGNDRDNMQRLALDFRPLDCSSPEGVEFVCQFVSPGN